MGNSFLEDLARALLTLIAFAPCCTSPEGDSPTVGGTGGGGSGGADGGSSGSGATGSGGDAGGGSGGDADGPLRGFVRIVEGRGVFDDGGNPMPYAYGRAEARFFDGVEPVWHEEALAEGDCRLFEYTPGFCEEFCEGVCIATNECQPWPKYLSAGTLVVSGLLAPVTMRPDELNNYYPPDTLPERLFAADATITAETSGAAIEALTLTAAGVPALESGISNGFITLSPKLDHEITWTPVAPDPPTRIRIILNANNMGHGQPYEAIIRCDAPDAQGKVVVGSSLVDRFPRTDNWQVCAGSDCPRSTIARYAMGRTPVTNGHVALEVSSVVEFGVVHEP